MAVRDWAKLGMGWIVSWSAPGLAVSSLILAGAMPSRNTSFLLLFAMTSTFIASIALYSFHVWAFFYLRLHPIPPGRCTACAYDLTGNVSGICPECGKPIIATTQDYESPERSGTRE